MPNLPPVSQADLIAAMATFDAEHRGRGRFARWPTAADKFALAHQGRYYPPKIIISLATGIGVNAFSGGAESTAYTDKRALVTVMIDDPLREALRAANQPPPQEV
ncbi:MAG: hypothetical protein WCI67_21620 [Chloroflexales bacterium]